MDSAAFEPVLPLTCLLGIYLRRMFFRMQLRRQSGILIEYSLVVPFKAFLTD